MIPQKAQMWNLINPEALSLNNELPSLCVDAQNLAVELRDLVVQPQKRSVEVTNYNAALPSLNNGFWSFIIEALNLEVKIPSLIVDLSCPFRRLGFRFLRLTGLLETLA
jgi:hypothetical protein